MIDRSSAGSWLAVLAVALKECLDVYMDNESHSWSYGFGWGCVCSGAMDVPLQGYSMAADRSPPSVAKIEQKMQSQWQGQSLLFANPRSAFA